MGVTLLVIAGLGAVALLVGRLARRVVPEIVVFLLIGIVIGPSGPLPVIDEARLQGLRAVTDVAVGVVMFLIGERLRWSSIRGVGPRLVWFNVGQVVLTGVLVGIATAVAGADASLAIVLAFVSVETGVLTVTAVVREGQAPGPGGHLLLSSVAVTNVVTVAAFGLMFPLLLAVSGRVQGLAATVTVFVQVAGVSAVIGVAAAVVLGRLAGRFASSGELLLFQLVVIVAVTGASLALGSSVVIAMLVAGLVTANRWPAAAETLFGSLRVLEPPIYLVFFLVAGAGLHLGALGGVGLIGIAYLVARTLGKVLGPALFASRVGLRRVDGARFGGALLPHAGLAVGLVAFVIQHAPNLGGRTATVVLAAVLVFEVFGPLGTRQLLRSGGQAQSHQRVTTALPRLPGLTGQQAGTRDTGSG